MLHIEEKELHNLLEAEYRKGVSHGVKMMEQKMLLACESGNPVEVRGKAYFIRSDIQNLKNIFDDLEKEDG